MSEVVVKQGFKWKECMGFGEGKAAFFSDTNHCV